MRTHYSISRSALPVLLISFFGAALRARSAGISMGRTVKKFQESTDIWNQLDRDWILPGYHNSFTNTPPTNGWINFLMKQGEGAINRSYKRIGLGEKSLSSAQDIKRLIHYAKDPLLERSFEIEHPVSRKVAAFLVEDYARYLKTDPHNVLVYEALKRIHLDRKGVADKTAVLAGTEREAQTLKGVDSEASGEVTDPASQGSHLSLSPSTSSK